MRNLLAATSIWAALVLTLITSWAPQRTMAVDATPNNSRAADLILVGGLGVMYLLDPVTGAVWDEIGESDAWSQLVPMVDSIAVVSVAPANGSETDIFRVDVDRGVFESIGTVPGRITALRVASEGDRLLLATWAAPTGQAQSPTGLVEYPLADELRSNSIRRDGLRDLGAGILAVRDTVWFGRVSQGFSAVTFSPSREPERETLSVPSRATYHSLLLSADEQTMILVDYHDQIIHVIDPERRIVERSIPLGLSRTKQRPCAAALSGARDRLYVIEHDANTADGIYVFNSVTWEQTGHFLPEMATDLECVAASPDGSTLYATVRGAGELVSLDAVTGDVLGRVQLPTGLDALQLVAITAA